MTKARLHLVVVSQLEQSGSGHGIFLEDFAGLKKTFKQFSQASARPVNWTKIPWRYIRIPDLVKWSRRLVVKWLLLFEVIPFTSKLDTRWIWIGNVLISRAYFPTQQLDHLTIWRGLYSEARQRFADVFNIARTEEVAIKRGGGDTFSIIFRKSTKSPFDVPGIKTKATTKDILDAVRASRDRFTE